MIALACSKHSGIEAGKLKKKMLPVCAIQGDCFLIKVKEKNYLYACIWAGLLETQARVCKSASWDRSMSLRHLVFQPAADKMRPSHTTVFSPTITFRC